MSSIMLLMQNNWLIVFIALAVISIGINIFISVELLRKARSLGVNKAGSAFIPIINIVSLVKYIVVISKHSPSVDEGTIEFEL